MCKQDSASEQFTKKYTIKELVMMETKLSNFNTSFYIIYIQKLAFQIPPVKILGKKFCGESRQTMFNDFANHFKMLYSYMIVLRV